MNGLIDMNTKDMYELTDLFRLKTKVKYFKKSGPSQYFACQNFGHTFLKYELLPYCIKCVGYHKTSECVTLYIYEVKVENK